MSRTLLLIAGTLLALVALSVTGAGAVVDGGDGPAGAIPTEQPARVENVSNTTNYLFPDEAVERRTYVTTNVDVSSAAAASATRLDSEHRAATVEQRFVSQSGEGESEDRLTVAEQALADAEARMERLDADQAALFRAYSNGTLSRQQFVRELVRLDARTEAYSEYLDELERTTERRVEDRLPSNFDTRLSTLRARTVVLPDALAERTRRVATGNADPFVLYAEGVDETLVLAAIDDGRFHRQATLRDAYRPDEANTLSIEGALQRATELYPWVYSGGRGFKPQIGIAGSGLFQVRASHPHGSLVSYISGSTANVFHENQTLDPRDIPVYRTVTNETEGINLSVTTTTQTGPMRVGLTTPAGVPVNGTVLVNGDPVETTGEDGTLWLVRPSGTFRLDVVGEDGAQASLNRVRFLRSS